MFVQENSGLLNSGTHNPVVQNNVAMSAMIVVGENCTTLIYFVRFEPTTV
jgi:hypothetical protein